MPPAAGSCGGPPSGACRSSAWRTRPTAARSPPAAGTSTTTTTSGYVRLRDAQTGAELGPPIAGRPGGVLAVAFAPDGRHARDGQPRRRRPPRPRRSPAPASPTGSAGTSTSSMPSPSARTAAASPPAGWDKTIRLWDRETGRLGGDPDRPPGVRPRAGLLARRPPARLRQRGQERPALGPRRRRAMPRSTATPGSSTAWPSGPTARWPRRAAWMGRSRSGRPPRPTPR